MTSFGMNHLTGIVLGIKLDILYTQKYVRIAQENKSKQIQGHKDSGYAQAYPLTFMIYLRDVADLSHPLLKSEHSC